MKITLQSLAAGSLLLSALFFAGCQKDGNSEAPEVTNEEARTISNENAEADSEYDELAEIGLSVSADLEVAAETNNGTVPLEAGSTSSTSVRLDFFANLYHKLGGCTKITVEPNDGSYPKTVTINYGDGCLCRDGKRRSGAVVLHFTAPLHQPDAVLTITLRSYFVNRVRLEGVKTITNLAADGELHYAAQVTGGKITWPSGRGFAYAGLKVITQVSGTDTRELSDDVFRIEGHSKTEYASGITVTKQIDTPLIRPVACGYIVEGVVKIQINRRAFSLDFGAGACDNKGLLIWAGGEAEINL